MCVAPGLGEGTQFHPRAGATNELIAGDDSMDGHTSTSDGVDLVHVQRAEVSFSCDPGLQDRAKRLTENVAQNTKCHGERQQPESPSDGFGAT